MGTGSSFRPSYQGNVAKQSARTYLETSQGDGEIYSDDR